MAIKWENALDILSLRQQVLNHRWFLHCCDFLFVLFFKSACKVAFYDLINYTFIPVKLCTWRLSYIKIIPISEVNLLAHLNWFSFFPPFISFLGLYLYIFHQNWGGENPIKLWRGTVPLVFLLSCWNWVYKECEKSLRSCTVRLFTKWTMPHLRFSDCPRKYASGSQFDSFCLSRVCKSPSWSRAVFCFGSWCLIQKIVSFFFLSFLYLKWCMCRHEYDLMAAVVGSLYLSTSVVEILWCSVVNCPVHLSAQLVSGREVCCLQTASSISSSAGISKGDSFLLWEIKLKAWGFFCFCFFFPGGVCVYFPFVQRSCVIAVLVR